MNEGREESEDREYVDLRNDEEFGWVHVIPVAKFMSWKGMRIDQESGKSCSHRGQLQLLRPCSA